MAGVFEEVWKTAGKNGEGKTKNHKTERAKPAENIETERKEPDQNAESQSKTASQGCKGSKKERRKEAGLVTDRQLLPRMPCSVFDGDEAGEEEK